MNRHSAAQALPTGHGIKRLYASLWHFAAGRRHLVVLFLGMLLLAQAIRLAIPYFFGKSVDALQTSGAQDLRGAAFYTAATVLAAVAGWALHGPGRVIERFTALGLRERFADALYAKAVSLPLAWQESHHSGETMQRMAKATQALFGFSQHQFIYLQNLISLVGPIAALFLISSATGGAALLGYGVIAVLLVKFDSRMLAIHAEENAAERRYSAELSDCLGNATTVLTLRLEEPTRHSLAERQRELSRPLARNVVVNEAKWCVIDLLNNAMRTGLVALYAWLSWRADGLILVGTAVMVHQYAQQIGNVVGSMATHWQDLVRFQADIASADEILTADSRPDALLSAPAVLDGWRHIAIEDLTFAHAAARSERPVIDRVDLTIARGERIALVGASGAGKSTLLRALTGLYQGRAATIRVDGRPVPGLSHLGPLATLVPQDPEIFEATIAQNLTMGIDYPPAAIARALDLACFAEVLAGLPDGLQTVITERGVNLSGGQKQRLALARAILAAGGSSLLLLDEPTSSVDPATESRLYDALLAEFPEACVISTLHRPHLLSRFDRVLVMENGKLRMPRSPADAIGRPAA